MKPDKEGFRGKKMQTENTDHKIQWLPILLIAWNIFDIAVHVAVDRVEPLRVSGNIVGIALSSSHAGEPEKAIARACNS